jgi:tetratricopeptide (TPR) repeat protein
MAWFPSLRRLSTRTRARLARRLSGHPRAVEFLEALVAASMAAGEDTNGEWTAPASSDDEGVEREWKELLEPVLPTVQQRIWSDLLLAALWDRVLDVKAQRMLFRMTLLRRPWDDGVLLHLGEPEDDAEATRQTARRLAATSLLEQTSLTVTTREGQARRPFHTIHAATAAFVKSRFGSADDLVVATHQRVGTHLEAQAPTSSDLSVDLEAGYHLFEAGEYDRAYELLGSASDQLHLWGRLREAVQVLVPLLAEPVKARMRRSVVARLFGTIGLAYAALGETRRAIEYHEQTLVISRETRDRSAEAQTLANLGTGYAALGEIVRAVEHLEQALVIAREVKDGRAELKILGNLGIAYAIQGETRRAMEYLERALAVSRALRDRRAEGQTLGNLGNTYGALDETSRAIEHHKQALVISRELHDLRAEGQDLTNLGNAYSALGEHLSAVAHYEQALVISRKSGDRRAEGQVLGNLGNIYLILGETQRAVDLYKQGLAIGRETSDPQIINTCEKGLKLCAELS